MAELKPCPFCGSKDLSDYTDEDHDGMPGFVRCESCGADGPCLAPTAAKAVEAWNTRK